MNTKCLGATKKTAITFFVVSSIGILKIELNFLETINIMGST